MRKGLVIRAVNFQMLESAIDFIKRKFGEKFEIYLLTHPHSLERAESMGIFKKVYSYERKGNFSVFFIHEILKRKKFDFIFIPLSNKRGYGFLNVLLFSLRLKAKHRFLVLPDGNIHKIGRWKILFLIVKNFFYGFISILITPFVFITYILILSVFKIKLIYKRYF